MRRILRYTAIITVLFLCATGGVTWWAYEAVQDVRPFYQEAMAVDSAVLRKASQELSSRATALVNDARRGDPWQAQFTEEQINGWLAIDLPEKHGDLIPQDIADPRVAIEDEQIKVGVHYSGRRLETVLSVDVEPYLAEPNVLALKILGARAGTLPIPLSEVTERMTKAAHRFRVPLTWTQEEETPIALVTLRLKSRKDGKRLQLETLELSGGAIRLHGVTDCEDSNAEDSPEAEADEKIVEPVMPKRKRVEHLIQSIGPLSKG
jgi:hypothetical protein